MANKNPLSLTPWEVKEFAWGAALRHRRGKWEKLFIAPDAQEVDVSQIDVILDHKRITFVYSTDEVQ